MGEIGNGTKGQLTIGSLRRKRSWPSHKFIKASLIILTIILFLIAFSFMLWVFLRPKPISTQTVSRSVEENLTLVNNGEYTQSLDQLNKLNTQKLTPTDRQKVLQSLALVYSQSGRSDRALENLLQAEKISTQPLTASSYATIASIYESQKKYSEAISYYQKAITQNKINPNPRTSFQTKVYENNINKIKPLTK